MSQVSIPLIIRRSQLKAVLGLSPSTVERLMAANDFPMKRNYTKGVVGWDGEEVADWVKSRVS